ncbi:MAG TPA: lipopeptide precursor [Gammaproteobacteria bacterium]|nr:lipopeptide precursor [Gammaproteobacteria bacterium]
MHRTYQLLLFLILLITAATLVACGQKGPLYMPDQEKQNEQKQHKS